MHGGAGADVDVILDGHVPAKRRMRTKDRVVADVTVVSDVHVAHEQIVAADRRDAAAAGRAAMNRHALTEDVLRAR